MANTSEGTAEPRETCDPNFGGLRYSVSGSRRRMDANAQGLCGLPLSELCQWNKLGLALLATLAGIAALHVAMLYLPASAAGMLAGLVAFSLVYVIAARLILREEYGYVMRAILRRKAA